MVSSDEEDFVNSDDGSITDFNWDMSEEEELMDSDDGSVADLDRDMSDVEVCCDSDVGSVADLEWNTWEDACALALRGAVGAFPPEAAVIRPAVVFRDILFLEEECNTAVVLARGEVPMSLVLPVTDKGVAMIPPVTNRHVQQPVSESVGGDAYNVRLCLLYFDSAEDLQDLWDGYVDSQRLNHWHTVCWDPGIADSRVLSVCYDCLCLMALFRAVMSLARYWAEEFVWTGHDEGCCRSIGWEQRYLPWIHPPCVVDRLGGYLTEIKVPGLVLVLSWDRNNSAQRCACMRGTFARGLFRGKDFAHADWLQRQCRRFGRLLRS